jgi:hypothetical protein
MRNTKWLAAALVAACLLTVAASPAAAQDIANPNGTAFSGTQGSPLTWSFGGGAVVVQCTNVTIFGNPAPPKGVTPNALGGPSTRMARFHPLFNGCTANVGGMAFGAGVTANCDWAYAVDTFNPGTGASTLRLQIGLGGCANALDAVTISIPGAGCTIGLHQQPLIDNGANIAIAGQDGPWPPPPSGMRVTHTITSAIARTAAGCAGVVNPNPPASMSGVFLLTGVWAGP